MSNYFDHCLSLIEAARVKISDIKPSNWAEQKVVLPKPFPGYLKYSKTPYTREIIDRFAIDDPAREIAVKGSAQFGKSASIVNPAVGWVIENDPANIIMTVGDERLLEQAMVKIDAVIDNAGLRPLIRPAAKRAKQQRSGDTNTKKEFPGGFFTMTVASNPNEIRQESYKYGFFDDFNAMKSKTKTDGSHRRLILKRFTAFSTSYKILWVSTPTIKGYCNIDEVYERGDKRKFYVPCPCCDEYITLEWETVMADGSKAGIVWQMDENIKLIESSVGYRCQMCGDIFKDTYKSDFINVGVWQPTKAPERPGIYSYHMNSLYSPHGMTSWLDYVYEWIEVHKDGVRDESKYQTFLNLNLGECYEAQTVSVDAKNIQKNTFKYEIGTIPEKISNNYHGNGQIVLLTCGADCNGTMDDARIDYEIVGWSESGSCYSIIHGSIGTFIPNESGKKYKEDRVKFTYDWSKPNNVWDPFLKVLTKVFETDTGRKMRVFGTGIDEGYMTMHVRTFVDKCNIPRVFSVKGQSIDNKYNPSVDKAIYTRAKERDKLYLVNIGVVKDSIAEKMLLKYDDKVHEQQPSGFMNYPDASNGLYQYKNFFSHYEAEERKVVETKDGQSITFRWEKKQGNPQNHQFDCRVYNEAIREIITDETCRAAKIKNHNWNDFVRIILALQSK